MLPELLEKPKVTEIQVRMDCNGCVQKIKKALHGINGIYDIYIDIPQQKLTIIGWADPEKIAKAIKKTRKTATICSPTIPTELESPGGGAPPLDPANPPVEEGPSTKQKSTTSTPPIPENPPSDEATAAAAAPSTDSIENQKPQSSRSKEVDEVHVVYHYPSYHENNVHAYRGHVGQNPSSQGGPGFNHVLPQPIHVNHSYNTYKPMPYVTEYEYICPPLQYVPYIRTEPPPHYTSYGWPEPSQTRYNQPEPPQSHSRPEPPPQRYSRPEESQSYIQPNPPPQQDNRLELPQKNQTDPPQHYGQPKPPQQYAEHGQPEPTRQYIHYNRPQPTQQYSHYIHLEPRQEYTQHSRVEPSPLHTYYSRLEPPAYMHYDDDYLNSNRNDDITSAFDHEGPNGCRIV